MSKSLVSVLWQRIMTLAEHPRPTQTRQLRGAEKAYRLRVRSYRIVYTIDDGPKVSYSHRYQTQKGLISLAKRSQ